MSEHLLAQYNAIKMLHSRVKMILAYVKAVKDGMSGFLKFLLSTCSFNKLSPLLHSFFLFSFSFEKEKFLVIMKLCVMP